MQLICIYSLMQRLYFIDFINYRKSRKSIDFIDLYFIENRDNVKNFVFFINNEVIIKMIITIL